MHAPHKRNSEAVADKVAEKQQHFVNPHDKAFCTPGEIGNWQSLPGIQFKFVYCICILFGIWTRIVVISASMKMMVNGYSNGDAQDTMRELSANYCVIVLTWRFFSFVIQWIDCVSCCSLRRHDPARYIL